MFRILVLNTENMLSLKCVWTIVKLLSHIQTRVHLDLYDEHTISPWLSQCCDIPSPSRSSPANDTWSLRSTHTLHALHALASENNCASRLYTPIITNLYMWVNTLGGTLVRSNAKKERAAMKRRTESERESSWHRWVWTRKIDRTTRPTHTHTSAYEGNRHHPKCLRSDVRWIMNNDFPTKQTNGNNKKTQNLNVTSFRYK